MEKLLILMWASASHKRAELAVGEILKDDFDVTSIVAASRAPGFYTGIREYTRKHIDDVADCDNFYSGIHDYYILHDDKNDAIDVGVIESLGPSKILMDLHMLFLLPLIHKMGLKTYIFTPCSAIKTGAFSSHLMDLMPADLPVLCQGIASFNPPRKNIDSRFNIDFVGYCGDTDVRSRGDREIQRLEASRIIVSLGTIVSDACPVLFDRLIALSSSLGFQLTIILGRDEAHFSNRVLPVNVTILVTVPSLLEMLPNFDLFITHGGINSVLEAILAEVPMLVLPVFGDQPYTADCIVNKGIGLKLSPGQLGKTILLNHLNKLIEQYVFYRANLRALSQQLREVGTRDVLLHHLARS